MTDVFLLTFMHIYIIICKESDSYYSQFILKYSIIPSGCKKSEMSVQNSTVGPFISKMQKAK